MKALVYTGRNTLTYRDEPDPEPRNDEVVLRVEAVGICGSDMHAYHGHDERRPAPQILGHEAAGVATSGRLKGKRVTVNPLVTCNTCDLCVGGRPHLCRSRQILSMMPRPGAFAELTRAPEQNLVEVPAAFDIRKAALAEPMAVGYHAVQLGLRTAVRPKSTQTCLILGGGAIGLCVALVLAMEGVARIHVAETSAARRATVAKAGPFEPYAPGGAGAPDAGSIDLVFDAVGADATRAEACRVVKPGGGIVHIGLLPGTGGIDIRRITLQEVTLVGSYCYTPNDFRETVAALVAGRLGALDWFEERSLANGARAFADIDSGTLAAAKIILRP